MGLPCPLDLSPVQLLLSAFQPACVAPSSAPSNPVLSSRADGSLAPYRSGTNKSWSILRCSSLVIHDVNTVVLPPELQISSPLDKGRRLSTLMEDAQ